MQKARGQAFPAPLSALDQTVCRPLQQLLLGSTVLLEATLPYERIRPAPVALTVGDLPPPARAPRRTVGPGGVLPHAPPEIARNTEVRLAGLAVLNEVHKPHSPLQSRKWCWT